MAVRAGSPSRRGLVPTVPSCVSLTPARGSTICEGVELPPSSRGLGCLVLSQKTGVRVPVGVSAQPCENSQGFCFDRSVCKYYGSERSNPSLQVSNHSFQIGECPIPLIVSVLFHGPDEGRFQGGRQLMWVQQGSVAQELQILSILWAKTLQLGCGVVVRFKLPETKN